ncbi:hypothetical protein MSG28_000325 [Choristoneura fumiferana]|uniref:Uncharacterized protein n=1 Tax=Choristoneura fumiferana TaxID=7141 RepID=A0ACC0K0S1_CHOFU|nr:hypothetical protein MSG28_000325 [Choristoneura fumiferana]
MADSKNEKPGEGIRSMRSTTAFRVVNFELYAKPNIVIMSIALLLLVILTNKTGCSTNMDSAALSSAIAKFSLQFCNELDKSKSVVSSPMSAEILLALLTLGSSDPAHGELLNAIGFKDDDSIRSSFSAVTSKLKSVKGVTLQVANKVYLQNGFDLDPKLKHDAIEIFDSDLEPLDFSNSGAAAKLINDWVESKTNKRIKDLISEDSGSWKYPFKPHNTIDKPFHINKDTTVNVPMMYLEENFKYGESQKLNAQLLEMPYEGGEASMVIILPKEVEGINDLLKSLATDVDLVQELNQMHPIKVQVTIPKFKIETEIDLKTLLPKIFNSPEPLYVSKAIQKAFIEVNEEGAEAAAATVAAIRTKRSMPRPPREFIADRPALWGLMVARQLAFVARYQPDAPLPRSDLNEHRNVLCDGRLRPGEGVFGGPSFPGCDPSQRSPVLPDYTPRKLMSTAAVRYAESSMRNGFGLRLLHKFLSVPFLRLQRTSLLEQLQRNQKDMEEAEKEMDDFQLAQSLNPMGIKAQHGVQSQFVSPELLKRPARSDDNETTNPKVTVEQDDVELDYNAMVQDIVSEQTAIKQEEARLEETFARQVSVHNDSTSKSELAGSDHSLQVSMENEFPLWAGDARRSPEGGEDPDVAKETNAKPEKKPKKKKSKSKDKGDCSEKSEKKEKKHKHKKSKSEKKTTNPQSALLEPTPIDNFYSEDDYDSI